MTDETMPELLPCPFCGGEATGGKDDDGWMHGVWCLNDACLAEPRVGPCKDDATAIAAWNRRADTIPKPDPRDAEIARLREYISKLDAFADHDSACPTRMMPIFGGARPCECGLTAIRKDHTYD